MVVLSGSAGVGKSELMCWWASKRWLEGNINNIIITRPHQHLGNDYGAVTGNDTMKLMPFCMSMLMKFKKYLGVGILRNNFRMEVGEQLFEEVSGIAIVPIEKIQGMSFDNKTIILADEIQSATPAQVKSLTTRMEEGCQLIIAGDKTQSPLRGENGLAMLEKVLDRYPHEDSEIIRFTTADNCRSGISGHLADVFEKEGTW
jgi:phosphate starvation-inducible PhoH-like protein